MSRISLFPNAKTKDPQEAILLTDFIDNIRTGKYRLTVDAVREATDEVKRKSLKKYIPGVTISGTFKKRKEKELISHSGFICIDIDRQVNRSELESDPYTYSLFDSASKQGVAIIVKINPKQHFQSYCWLERYYHDTYGIIIDNKPKNVASLRFASYDPDVKINENSKRAGTLSIAKKPKSVPVAYPPGVISDLVDEIVKSGICITDDYENYRNIAFGFAHNLKGEGRPLFHALASMSDKYEFDVADDLYAMCLDREDNDDEDEDKRDSFITIGTFLAICKNFGFRLPEGDKSAIAIAATGKRAGLNPKETAQAVADQTELTIEQAEQLVTEVNERSDITLNTLSKEPEHLIESLVSFVKTKYPLQRNGVTYVIEQVKTGKSLTEEDINDIFLHAKSAFNSPHVTKDLVNSIIFSNFTPTYNPFTDYYSANYHLNGEGHISKLISSISTTTPMAEVWIRKWLISLHAAVEGHPVRIMLTFTGPQYNGKTEFFRRLLPKSLKQYYAESKLDRGKDDELLMCQKLIVMDDEMGGKSKQDEKRLKELTSKDTFSLRAPYRRDNMDYKRLAVLCGTSNPTEIINDPTGNTRILPVKVDSINYELINSVNKDELFMEAYRLYKSGESWLLTLEEAHILNSMSEDFSSIAYEKELIRMYFDPVTDGDTRHVDYMTATEIKQQIELSSQQQIRDMKKFGIELRNLFGDPKSKKRGTFMASKCYSVIKKQDMQSTFTDYSSPNKDDDPLPF